MEKLAKISRGIAKFRFRILKLATIKNLSEEDFKRVCELLAIDGWKARRSYFGFDQGIDYDAIKLRKGLSKLKCEWDNWTEWSIEGPRAIIESIAIKANLKVTHAWRWSDYD